MNLLEFLFFLLVLASFSGPFDFLPGLVDSSGIVADTVHVSKMG